MDIKICIEGYDEIGSGALPSYPPTKPDLFRADGLVIGYRPRPRAPLPRELITTAMHLLRAK